MTHDLNLPNRAAILACEAAGLDPVTLRTQRFTPRFRDASSDVFLPTAIDGAVAKVRSDKSQRTYVITRGYDVDKVDASSLLTGTPALPTEFDDKASRDGKALCPATTRATHHSLWVMYAAYLLPYLAPKVKRVVVGYAEAFAKHRAVLKPRADQCYVVLPSMIATTPHAIQSAMGAPSGDLFFDFLRSNPSVFPHSDAAIANFIDGAGVVADEAAEAGDAQAADEVESTDEA